MASSHRPAARLAALLALALLAVSAAAQPAVLAQDAYREGRFEDAVALSLQAVDKDPRAVEGYLVLCWSYSKLGKWESAATYASKALATHRYDYRLLEILGRAYYNLGRNDEALKAFQDYVSLLPEGGQAGAIYYLMGELYIRLGRFGHADICLTTAVNFMPSDAYAWSRLGYARERGDDPVHALEAYLQSLKLNPALKDSVLGKERVERDLRG
jgi:tetratricopeptide (TPR) repeat protein